MKNLFAIIVCTLLFVQVNAQIKLGVKGGISTTELKSDQLLIQNLDDFDELKLSVNEANYGIHLGLFLQANIGKFFIQPEVLFNSNSVEFKLEDINQSNVIGELRKESYQYLDIPIMMGFKLGPLRLGAGPVAHVFLNSRSELFDIDGYAQKFDETSWGWQAGAGLDIWKFMLDFRYEGNFNKFGDHVVFHDQKYQFNNAPGRMVFSLGFAF